MKLAAWLNALLDTRVHGRIASDPRTAAAKPLGCPKHRVFKDAIDSGQADFDASRALSVDGQTLVLSGDDRALLYAMFNQPRHLDELRHAFELLSPDGPSVVNLIDIGCGPCTAGLAYASVVGAGAAFRYYGIDRAGSMRRLAEELFRGAAQAGGLHPQTRASFSDSLESAKFDKRNWGHSLAVVCYLLSSQTVNPAELAQQVAAALDRAGPGNQTILHINSANMYANRNWPVFREALAEQGFGLVHEEKEPFTDTDKSVVEISYALFHRPKQEVMKIGDDR
jgi:hypothetical protein